MSPPSAGFSILITSAPRSASCIEPYGPAPYCSTAMTRRPESGGSTTSLLAVIASEAKQSPRPFLLLRWGLLRRYAPRNDSAFCRAELEHCHHTLFRA